MSGPLRILLSDAARAAHGGAIAAAVPGRPVAFVAPGPGADAEVAFLSRDVTGLSTKHEVLPATQAFYDALLAAPGLRWTHIHSAGADRPVFDALRARGVRLSTSSGTNAGVVAQTAVAGLLALARRFPQLMAAQRAHRWAPLIGSGLPRDLAGQTAVVVGWGPIGQRIGTVLQALGLSVVVVRSSARAAGLGLPTVAFEDIGAVLPRCDWLVLVCPLTDRTRGLVGAPALALLPPGAHLLNLARGDVVDEPALVEALQEGRLAGAFLDVFAHEPLPAASPLWDLPTVIATPHSAGFSDGNAARVVRMFLDNLGRWCDGSPLLNPVA
ncbi:D-2-hydroxyacid dehydrogenase [Xylophilus sp. Leaf220]|uniref:D-2-hydroxyacid dehydrogenase n=1 Tax=Xylophilus sp. Leaf220 TaxID=1735686 RepID=UPI0006F3D329|nr:D-2-hydroxyacid dehydrogenase [Xylophilus sp. Leaf220]KQM78712.1 hydroxyacid dehydrogenase [Xylophilus sp. Leaf220]